MKKAELNEVKKMEIKALIERSKKLRQEVAEITLDKKMNKLKDLKTVDKKRKDLAKVLTILRQKQLLVKLEVQNG